MPQPSTLAPTHSVAGVDVSLRLHDYSPAVQRYVLAAKNGGRRDLLVDLGRQIGAMLAAGQTPSGQRFDAEAVVWVPASRRGRRRRGYDQGRLLARPVSRALAIAPLPLLRRTDSRSQHGLGRPERLAAPSIRCRTDRAPSRLILIDDVLTTGSSISAAALALRRSGTDFVVSVAVAGVEG